MAYRWSWRPLDWRVADCCGMCGMSAEKVILHEAMRATKQELFCTDLADTCNQT